MIKKVYDAIDEIIYSKKLDNGLTVLLLPKEEMSKTYSLFSTNYGSIDQSFVPYNSTEKITVPEGIAHFLEHKLFEKEDHDVFADFGKQGASANAYTSFTNTAYLFSATSQIEQNLLTLLDFVQDPYFSDQSVEKEKGIIEQEIKMYDDQPGWQSFMGTMRAMYVHHPANIDIAGTADSIKTITKEDLYTCYHTFYHPQNMTLFVAGNFNPEEIMHLIEENQSKKEFPKAKEIERFFPEEPSQVATEELVVPLPVSIPKCTVGIKELTRELSKEEFLFRELMLEIVLDHYFSKGGSFYQTLYDEQLIDSSFGCSATLERGFGYTMISGDTSRPDDFANKVKELLLQTKNDALTAEELEILKRKKIGQLLSGMNSLEFIANQYTHYYQFDIDLFEMIPSIQEITLEAANNFLQNWIDEERLTVCKVMEK